MLKKVKTAHPNSPLSPFAWRLTISAYVVYVVLCMVIIAIHLASHYYSAIYLLLFSILNGLIVMRYLWSGVVSNYAGQVQHKEYPRRFWFSVYTVLFVGVILFLLGSGWFIKVH